jgi:PTS system fructose-specific IIC component
MATKVETNGSGGAKNVLTAEEIAKCDGIVIAADKNVEMARFDGKPVVVTRVADGIHKPEELINKIINKEAPIYHHKGGAPAADSGASAGSTVYKHLMNGISHMLPFVVGGGIMIALAFLLDDYSIDPSNFGSNTPLAAFFKSVGGDAFGFMLPVLAGFIAMSIADRPGLAVGFTGGALAASGLSFSSIFSGAAAVPSGFLGALLAGFVAGYVVLFLENVTESLPKSLDGIRPMLIYPFGGILTIGVVMCAVNPFMGMINGGIASLLNSMGGASAILLGAVVGGMMSVDMGGPVNKAAYAFGLAALESGNYGVMAAVMVGGMVPPIVIALSTTLLARNKWTEEERNNGIVNYVMGLCFISEGAIPYAAGDPLRVLPSCIIGSAVGGGLSMAFGCTLMAPHGGIFVFPTVGNPVMYIVALLVGSFVGAAILSAIKPARK